MTSHYFVLDSVTHLTAEHRGHAVYGGSHGARYAGAYAAAKGVGAVILNDAGIGRDRAGISGLPLLDALGVPAAAISSRTGRIGDGRHAAAHGILSAVNDAAQRLGLAPGMACKAALELLARAPLTPAPQPPKEEEARFLAATMAGIPVFAMDSISLVDPATDDGAICVTASHGGILGGKPETAVKGSPLLVVCNDADRGIDDAGLSRLPPLDGRGVAAATVSAFSARIGDGRSSWEDGYISAVNQTAARMGGLIGMSCRELVETIAKSAKRR